MTEPLFVETWGSGPPVVFVHGLGASARYWERVREVSAGYRGIAPDLLGFGRSPSPPDASYDVDCHVSALEPHIPAGSLIVAHSTGAIVAAAFAARHPHVVAGLVLIGLPAYPDEATARAEIGGLGLMARLTAAGHPFARRMCNAMCRVRPLAILLAPLVIRDLPPSIAADAARHTWPSYHRTLERVVIAHRPLADLVAARPDTLILHGADDSTAPLGHVERLVEQAGNSGVPVVLEIVDGDHHLAIRRPEVVAAAIASRLPATGSQGSSSSST